MKTPVLPAPKQTPARIGAIQWIDAGAQVQANQSSPAGIRMAQMHTIDTMASGGGFPVSGSGLWLSIMRRISGSQAMVMREPIPMPQKASPDIPSDQPRISPKTMG